MPACKLTDEQYFEAKRRIESGELEAHVAESYGMARGSLKRLIRSRGERGTLRTYWKSQVQIPTEQTVLAYVAGIIDGEGSVIRVPEKHNGKMRYHVKCGMTDRAPIDLLASFGGTVRSYVPAPGRKLGHFWVLARQMDVLAFLQAILPYMRVKQEKARDAVVYIGQAMWDDKPRSERPPKRTLREAGVARRAYRSDTEKVCRTCDAVKPLEAFQRNRFHWDGLQTQCRACANARRRKARGAAANPPPQGLPGPVPRR